MMDKDELKPIIEAILFAWSEPLSVKDLGKILGINTGKLANILQVMMDEFNYNRRGIQILQMGDYYQLATRPEYQVYLEKLFQPRQNKGLTNAALETLAIIAYKQPVTRIEVENIRGVKCDRVIGTLLERDLIEEQGRLERIGRPIIYGTTVNFLRVFGLKNLDELPRVTDFDLLNGDLIGEGKLKNENGD